MVKLKALRGAVGTYGRVAAGGIIDVDHTQSDKLKKTKLFVDATEADIEAAQKAQKAALALNVSGASAAFMPIPTPTPPATADRLSGLIADGTLTTGQARSLVDLELRLSTDEIQAFIKAESDKIFAEMSDAHRALDERQTSLRKLEADLNAAQFALDAREAAVAEREKAPEKPPTTASKPKEDAKAEKPADDTRAAK